VFREPRRSNRTATAKGVFAMPAYIKLPDIDGEVEEQEHDKWIEVDSVSMPIFRSITEGAKGAQRRSGETSLGDFVVVKQWDSASAKMAEYVCNGKHVNEVVVHLCSTINDKNVVNMEIKLKDVIFTGYSFMGTATQQPVPTEQITMNYTEIEWKYSKFDRMGADAGQFPAKYSTEAARS
jgi:type VI secretion system secreted protein Hcp